MLKNLAEQLTPYPAVWTTFILKSMTGDDRLQLEYKKEAYFVMLSNSFFHNTLLTLGDFLSVFLLTRTGLSYLTSEALGGIMTFSFYPTFLELLTSRCLQASLCQLLQKAKVNLVAIAIGRRRDN